MHRRLLFCLLLAQALTSAASHAAGSERVDSRHWSSQYDGHFQKYAKRYFGPNFDWKWFKAQAIAESGLNPAAESSTGARGLMQILPSTFAEIRKLNPYFSHIDQPRWNIAAGIYYDRYLYDAWSEIPDSQRLFFAFASYNAGLGGMLGAYQRSGGQATDWPEVAGFVQPETRNYVERIRRLRNREQKLQAAPRRLRLEMLSQDAVTTGTE